MRQNNGMVTAYIKRLQELTQTFAALDTIKSMDNEQLLATYKRRQQRLISETNLKSQRQEYE